MRSCFCAAESDAFAHTASTSWRVCCPMMWRCSIAAFETPATCQQGSRRFVGVVPRVVDRVPGTVLPGIPVPAPVEVPGVRKGGVPTAVRFPCAELFVCAGGCVSEVWASDVESAIPASSAGKAYRFHGMGSLLIRKINPYWGRKLRKSGRVESAPCRRQRQANAIIKICPRLATRSGRVAQLAEQLTLNCL